MYEVRLDSLDTQDGGIAMCWASKNAIALNHREGIFFGAYYVKASGNTGTVSKYRPAEPPRGAGPRWSATARTPQRRNAETKAANCSMSKREL